METFWSVDSNVSSSKNCRILLVWDSDKVSLTILEKHEQFVHCKVESKDLKWEYVLTVVYALNLPDQRGVLWKCLEDYSK